MAEQDDYVKLQIRIPSTVHSELKSAAAATNQSLNKEIVTRLEGCSVVEKELNRVVNETADEIEQLKKSDKELRAALKTQEDVVERMEAMDKSKTRMFYEMLQEVAETLSKPNRTPEDERDLLIEIIKTMASLAAFTTTT